MLHEIINRGGNDTEETDDDGGFQVGVPGTDYHVTTDPDEADVLGPGTPGDVLEGARDLADPTEPAEFIPGVTEVRERERFAEEAERFTEADGVLGQFDAAVAAGTDFLLDHPDASVQEGTRGGLVRGIPGVEDEEELAEAAQAADEGLTERIDRAVEGTPLDTRATDAVRTAGDVLIAEGGRIMAGAATDVDVEEGEVGARTGALETADVGLTLGTLGAGRAAMGAARAGDDLFDLGRFRRADPEDAAAPATRRADDVTARAADEADDALLPVVREADEVAPATRVTDDATGAAARVTDEATDVGARVTDRVTDAGAVGARVGDDVTGAAARTTDEVAGAGARITDRVSDAFRGTADTFSMAGTRVGQAARRAAGTRGVRYGAAGAAIGAGIVGGGALVDQLRDRYEMADGTVLVKTDTFPETDRFDGGVLFAIEENGSRLGYTVVVGEQGRNIVMLDENGDPTRAPMATDELQDRAVGPGGG